MRPFTESDGATLAVGTAPWKGVRSYPSDVQPPMPKSQTIGGWTLAHTICGWCATRGPERVRLAPFRMGHNEAMDAFRAFVGEQEPTREETE